MSSRLRWGLVWCVRFNLVLWLALQRLTLDDHTVLIIACAMLLCYRLPHMERAAKFTEAVERERQKGAEP